MRLNLKVVLLCLCTAVFFITISFWSHCGDLSLPKSFLPKWDRRIYEVRGCDYRSYRKVLVFFVYILGGSQVGDTIEEMDCVINQEYTVPCRREGDEVYVPFSFLHDYFEVTIIYKYELYQNTIIIGLWFIEFYG